MRRKYRVYGSSRLSRMENYRQSEDSRLADEKSVREARCDELVGKIEQLIPRVMELVETYNDAVNNRIPLNVERGTYRLHQNSFGGRNLFANSFRTDGIYHQLGFYLDNQDKYAVGVGIENGGANGCYDLIVDDTGVSWEYMGDGASGEYYEYGGDYCFKCLKKFLDKFDSLESDFYNYIDSVIG